jgi:hypothetical protein
VELVLLQDGPPPFSAFALCFFPLAAVVLGTIAFFVLTDAHARRPYLRFNPFIAYETPPEELAQRPPASGETPVGTLGAAKPGRPSVYDGPSGSVILPDPPREPTPTEQEDLAAEESIGEIPLPPRDPETLEKLNRPPSLDDDDPSKYS